MHKANQRKAGGDSVQADESGLDEHSEMVALLRTLNNRLSTLEQSLGDRFSTLERSLRRVERRIDDLEEEMSTSHREGRGMAADARIRVGPHVLYNPGVGGLKLDLD